MLWTGISTVRFVFALSIIEANAFEVDFSRSTINLVISRHFSEKRGFRVLVLIFGNILFVSCVNLGHPLPVIL